MPPKATSAPSPDRSTRSGRSRSPRLRHVGPPRTRRGLPWWRRGVALAHRLADRGVRWLGHGATPPIASVALAGQAPRSSALAEKAARRSEVLRAGRPGRGDNRLECACHGAAAWTTRAAAVDSSRPGADSGLATDGAGLRPPDDG